MEWWSSKRQEISFGKVVEKREALCTVGGDVNWYSHYVKQYGGAPKVKNRTVILYTHTHITESIYIIILKREQHANVTAALFTITRTWTEPVSISKERMGNSG